MKLSQVTRKLLVIALIAAWLVYAAVNLFSSAPYLASAYERTQGSTAAKLYASAEAANGRILMQSHLQDAVGSARVLMGQEAIRNYSLVQGEDGQMIYTNFYPYETYADFDAYGQRMQQLATFTQSQGASFVYLNCLALYSEEIDNYGDWPVNDLNARSDAFLYYLSGYDVDHLDARTMLKNSPLDKSEYRFRTEPHWTIKACFEVFTQLVDHLKAQGSSIDPDGFYTDSANYDRNVYVQSYLGKLGKMAGATYSGYDDFTLITPAFETDFTINYARVDDENEIRGDFASTILDSHWMSHEDVYENDMYCLYLSEVYAYRKITNHLNQDGPKLLVLGDSYMLPVAAFLATTASEVHLLSPYDLPNDTQSILAYVAENQFDHVIVGLNPGTLYGTGWNFLAEVNQEQLEAATLMAAAAAAATPAVTAIPSMAVSATAAVTATASASPKPEATDAVIVEVTAPPVPSDEATPTTIPTITPVATATPTPRPATMESPTVAPAATVSAITVDVDTAPKLAGVAGVASAETIAPTPKMVSTAAIRVTPTAVATMATTPKATAAATPKATNPPTAVAATPKPTASASPTAVAATPTPVAVGAAALPTATATAKATPKITATPVPTKPATPGPIPTPTARATPIPTPKPVNTPTPKPTASATTVAPTAAITATPKATSAPAASVAPSPAIVAAEPTARPAAEDTFLGTAIVSDRSLHIRKEPGRNTKVARNALRGERFNVISLVDDEWYEVALDDGETGFVHASKVMFIDGEEMTPNAGTVTVERDKAYVRVVPKANTPVLSPVYAGDTLELIGAVNDRWLEVKLADGRVGFIFAAYVAGY